MRNETDRLVSDTYNELADEKTPEALNREILRLAAKEGRTRYSIARGWMRPVAWAAVIGLSLAIILDMMRLPQVEPDLIGIPAPDSRSAGDQGREASEGGATDAEGVVPPSAALIEKRTNTGEVRPASRATDDPARLPSGDLVPKDMTILRDAEEMARTQAGSDRGPVARDAKPEESTVNGYLKREMEPDVTAEQAVASEGLRADEGGAESSAGAASFATMAASEPLVSSRYCTEPARREPESWMACIRELERNGQEAEARDEYEEFRRVFPDFDVEDVDK